MRTLSVAVAVAVAVAVPALSRFVLPSIIRREMNKRGYGKNETGGAKQ